MISKESPRYAQDVDRSILRTGPVQIWVWAWGKRPWAWARGDEVVGGLGRCIGESHLTQCGRNGQGNDIGRTVAEARICGRIWPWPCEGIA